MPLFASQGIPARQLDNACRTIVVWGPTGAPGRTTIAVGLAGAVSRAPDGGETLIVDADMARGKVACYLGASPGNTLITACALPPLCDVPCAPGHLQRPRRDGPWLIAGLSKPEQWRDVEPDRLAQLLGDLRSHFGVIVIDVGAELPPDPRGERHRVALQAADLVLVVCRASPAGLEDFCVQYPHLLMTLGAGAETHFGVVLNHVAPETLPRYRAELTRRLGVNLLAGLPHDHASTTRAEEMRQALLQAAPRSAIAVAVCRLAGEVCSEGRTGRR